MKDIRENKMILVVKPSRRKAIRRAFKHGKIYREMRNETNAFKKKVEK
jgi:hypothetical protein